ncbi:MAG: DUF4263 domain-containing protein, partial [Caulobacteraceae bacterium]|nr:DUF4263 domain-containing protein [Caulobacteraceae bacterium]
MARNPNRSSRGVLPDHGKIIFAQQGGGATWTLHIDPKPSSLAEAEEADPTFQAPKAPVLLAMADGREGWIETYPTNTTRPRYGLFGPKYDLLRTIRFENLNMLFAETITDARWALGRLIDGFVTTPESGLGVDFELISIVDELEAAKVSRLVVRAGPRKGLPDLLPDGSLVMAGVQFDELRRAVRRIHDKALDQARDEKHRTVHNTLLTVANPARFPVQPPPYTRGAIVAAIRAGTDAGLSIKDQDATLAAMAPVARKVASRKPQAVEALVREIELVTLEELIARFEQRLAANGDEEAWQKFFKTHPFILKLAFGYPILAMGDQISVGGGRFDGKGEKI